MHIVYVSREYGDSLRGGGIASYIKTIAIGLVKLGHQVTVICASDDTRTEKTDKEDGLKIIRLSKGDFVIPSIETKFPVLKRFRIFYRFYPYRKKIRTILLSLNDIDIVEVAEFGAEGFYIRNLNIPVIIRLHTPSLLERSNAGYKKLSIKNLPEYWVGFHENVIIRGAKEISSCSGNLKEWIVRYLKVNPDKIKVIYNPVNIDYWKIEPSKRPGLSNRILFAGTVVQSKGIVDLIEGCSILNSRGTRIELIIAGKLGDYGKKLKFLVHKKKYTWCTFLGHVASENLKQLYQECAIACFPSWWENMSLVIIEAMAEGCIVIGSNSGGTPEIIADGVNGFLINPRKPVELATKIKEVLNLSIEEKEIIRENAGRTVSQKFSSEVVLREMIKFYQEIINTFEKKAIRLK